MTDAPSRGVPSAPLSVDVALTGSCNLSCGYCFYADEMVALDDLPTERWLAFFAELGELAVQRVQLTGGEVFTRPDLFDLIDGVIENRMRYAILSNGTLVTEEVLEAFEVGRRRLRLDSIQVSIDGSRAEIHDRSRPRSFVRALRGLRLLVENGFPAVARVTVNRYNVDDLENVAQLLLDDVGLPSFSTNEAYSCGATARTDGNVLLTPAQRDRAMATLVELAERYGDRIQASAGPLAYARESERIEGALAAGEREFPGRGTLSACGGMWNKLAVLHDGAVVPCHQLSTLRLGIVGEDDLQRIWLEHPTMAALRRRHTIPLETLDTCRACAYVGFCGGGCPQGALQVYGELDARNPHNCYRVLKGEDPFFQVTEDVPDGMEIGA